MYNYLVYFVQRPWFSCLIRLLRCDTTSCSKRGRNANDHWGQQFEFIRFIQPVFEYTQTEVSGSMSIKKKKTFECREWYFFVLICKKKTFEWYFPSNLQRTKTFEYIFYSLILVIHPQRKKSRVIFRVTKYTDCDDTIEILWRHFYWIMTSSRKTRVFSCL